MSFLSQNNQGMKACDQGHGEIWTHRVLVHLLDWLETELSLQVLLRGLGTATGSFSLILGSKSFSPTVLPTFPCDTKL